LVLPQPGEDLPELNLTYDIKDNKTEKKANLYKIKKKTITKDDVTNLAGKFNLSSSVEEDHDNFTIRESKRMLQHSKNTDKFIYLEDTDITTDNNLLTESDAKAKALNILKEMGIPTNDLKFTEITNQVVTQGDKIKVPMLQKVYFQQTLNNEDIYGIAKVVVILGDQGKLVGLYNLRNDLEVANVVPLKDKKKAFNQIKEKGLVDLNATDKDHTAKIHSARVAYYSDPAQDYVQPVYVLGGTTNDGNDFNSYVPAIDDSLVTDPPTENSVKIDPSVVNPPKQQYSDPQKQKNN
jgi:hypothetical protein